MCAMKYQFLALLFFICGYSQSQDYIPMLDEENIWSLYWSDGLSGTSGSANYHLRGEEVINGETYKILFTAGIQLECRFREENGILYAYNPNTGLDEPRLDFTLEVGDTFEVASLANGGGDEFCFEGYTNLYDYLEVVEVDSQFIAGDVRKILTMSSMTSNGNPIGFEQYWIEGIGSTIGMFGPGIITFEILSELMCFERNGVITFFNGFNECEDDGLGIGAYHLKDIRLFPNPVVSTSILQFSSEGAADTVHILDIFGRVISEEKVQSDHVLIDAKAYSSGVYFYQVFSEKQLLKTEKFIVK
jgi:hypothetical protein